MRTVFSLGREINVTSVIEARPSSGTTGATALATMSSQAAPRHTKRILNEGVIVAIVSLCIYGTAAAVLDFRYQVYPPDAVSRMANGFYVMYSRHFHLAAIGFVWNPGTSIADMVPLLFKDLWAPITTWDVGISIVTVVSMTGTVHQLRAWLREIGLNRATRLVLTALFILNPMIVFYAANGMSEALYLFTTVGTARYLSRWLSSGDTNSLVLAATMLAVCYLAREEAVAIAVFSGTLVLGISAFRASGRPHRIYVGLTDAAVYLLPFTAVFLGWAVASYVITGSAFQQFTSQYGNSEQLKVYASYYHLLPGHYLQRAGHEAIAFEAIAPLLPLLLIVALIVAVYRRDSKILSALAVLGGGLLFTIVGFLGNQVFPWFRFYILAVPLEVFLAGYILAPCAPSSSSALRGANRTKPRLVMAGLATVAALIVVAPSIATTAVAMNNPKIGIEESSQLREVFHPSLYKPPISDGKLLPIMPYLEHMNLPDGDVVTENAYDCMPTIITRINNPKVFVIDNDSDFQRILADPLTWHAHYIVVPPPANTYNAISVQYPTLYKTGAGFARLVRQFPSTAICPTLRLYKVTGHTTTP